MERGLDSCFQKLIVMGGERVETSEWKDIPMELLLRIISLLDDRTVIMLFGVCCGWREAIFSGLTRLSLNWCKNRMNNLVISLAPKLSKLKTLSLRQDMPQLEDDCIEILSKCCSDLHELNLSKSFKLTDRALVALAHGCPNLTNLNISGCSSFSDSALQYLTNFCTNLNYLNLCGCVNAVTDASLLAIGKNCGKLQVLNLGWCERVTDVGVTCLARGCPELQIIDLCSCINITDTSVIALANGCNLRSLGLCACMNITDQGINSLAHGPRIMDWTMKKSLLETGLRFLNISQCRSVTPKAVQALLDLFPALHTCPNRHSLVMSGLTMTTVHCACGRSVQARQAHRVQSFFPHPAH